MLATLYYCVRQIRRHKDDGASWSQLRHLPEWRRSLGSRSSPIEDRQPWLTYDVIEFLKGEVHRDARVFEYGCGGSTLFLLGRAKEVYTVEHDSVWFEVVSDIVKKEFTNWVGVLVQPQAGEVVESPDKAHPDHYASEDPKATGRNFRDYASYIDRFPDDYFDIVVVDGRSRPSCIKHSIPKVKRGGCLIVDNSDRKYYLEHFKAVLRTAFDAIVDGFGATPSTALFTKTSVWRKR